MRKLVSFARQLLVAVGLCSIILLFHASSVHAQSCSELATAYGNGMRHNQCTAGLGEACYLQAAIDARPAPERSVVFDNIGDIALLADLHSLTTKPKAGAAYLLGGAADHPVKIFVFGDSQINPADGSSSSVFALRNGNQGPVCDRARSGMVLQTPKAQQGTLVVNGVTIKLGSTAYVATGADLLFDQNPRMERRSGERNFDAPLCSGFDSDCNFGDQSCSTAQRLVWGPYCRKDIYPYIENGLYRIMLYGSGSVVAGATDYGASGDHFSLGSQEMDLPGSYTFCWNGLSAGASGFETIVKPLSAGAAVSRITVEYLGRDCSLPTAPATAESAPLGIMTVYNIEGSVQVAAAGAVRALKPNERARIYFQNEQPVALDGPFPSGYMLSSPLAQAINSQAATNATPVEAKAIAFTADSTSITDAQCTTLRWDVRGVKAIYLDDAGVTGQGTREVCPDEDATYTMRIVNVDGLEEQRTVTVGVSKLIPPYLTIVPTAQFDAESNTFYLFTRVDIADDDWIDEVTFAILDANGKQVYSQNDAYSSFTSPTATGTSNILCLFGGPGYPDSLEYPCKGYAVAAQGWKWPGGGSIYGNGLTLRIFVRTGLGLTASQDVKFNGLYVRPII